MRTIDEKARLLFRQFVADEVPAIGQLRQFVGGELRPALDESPDSLRLLDQFIGNLTSNPGWTSSPLFAPYTKDIRAWLTVRLAYYLASCLRARFGGEWRLSEQEGSPFYGTPVLRIRGREISPLEIARGRLDGLLSGGLPDVVSALERELAPG